MTDSIKECGLVPLDELLRSLRDGKYPAEELEYAGMRAPMPYELMRERCAQAADRIEALSKRIEELTADVARWRDMAVEARPFLTNAFSRSADLGARIDADLSNNRG